MRLKREFPHRRSICQCSHRIFIRVEQGCKYSRVRQRAKLVEEYSPQVRAVEPKPDYRDDICRH